MFETLQIVLGVLYDRFVYFLPSVLVHFASNLIVVYLVMEILFRFRKIIPKKLLLKIVHSNST